MRNQAHPKPQRIEASEYQQRASVTGGLRVLARLIVRQLVAEKRSTDKDVGEEIVTGEITESEDENLSRG